MPTNPNGSAVDQWQRAIEVEALALEELVAMQPDDATFALAALAGAQNRARYWEAAQQVGPPDELEKK